MKVIFNQPKEKEEKNNPSTNKQMKKLKKIVESTFEGVKVNKTESNVYKKEKKVKTEPVKVWIDRIDFEGGIHFKFN